MNDSSQSPYGLCGKCYGSLLELNQEFCAICGARQASAQPVGQGQPYQHNYPPNSSTPLSSAPSNFAPPPGWLPSKKSSDTGADTVGTIIRAVLCVIAALAFFSASGQMSNIHSISGDSIAEAFYHAMGMFSTGAGWLCLALAIPTRRIHL